jgi:hypothetical protein
VTRSKTMTLTEAVDQAMDQRAKNVVRCPAHDDQEPSLSVSPGTTQPVLLKCQAGCSTDEILAAEGLDWAKVSAPIDPQARVGGDRWTPAGDWTRRYLYTDVEGTVLYEVLRVDLPGGKKRILQRRPDHNAPHGHTWNLEGVQRVLYRLPEVVAAVAQGRTVHITEGEKCADAIRDLIPMGDVSTTNPQGADFWLPEFSEYLAGATVILYADSDDAGRAHMRNVRSSLEAVGCRVTTMEAPSGVIMKSGKVVNDVADHVELGLGLDTLMEMKAEASVERAKTGIDVLDLLKRPFSKPEYVIDNTLAKGERLIVIGFEGNGKSTLLRQIAVCVAAGIHPFTGMAMEQPQKVLFIDAENHPNQVTESWSHLVGLAARHGFPVRPGMLTIMEEWSTGRDITTPDGSAWLEERVHAYQPGLVIMGPLTNMADRDLRDDEPVRRIRHAVDRARADCNSAFIMEHHAPLKGGLDKERPLRPYGSSLFLKWPDYGFGIKPTENETAFEWAKFRGARVRSREWPEGLREGRPNSLEWPWVPCVFDPSTNAVIG